MTVGGDRGTEKAKDGKFTAGAQNEHLRKRRTAEIVAKEYGVGKETVKRAEKFVKGVDAAEKITQDTQKQKTAPGVAAPRTVIGAANRQAYCPPIITNVGGKCNAKKIKYSRRVWSRYKSAAV